MYVLKRVYNVQDLHLFRHISWPLFTKISLLLHESWLNRLRYEECCRVTNIGLNAVTQSDPFHLDRERSFGFENLILLSQGVSDFRRQPFEDHISQICLWTSATARYKDNISIVHTVYTLFFLPGHTEVVRKYVCRRFSTGIIICSKGMLFLSIFLVSFHYYRFWRGLYHI